jgi:hypothetical protein
MRYLLALSLLLMLTGCPLDVLFGVVEKPDGTVETDGTGGGVGFVGGALTAVGGPVGLAGLAVSLIGNLYQSIRKRQYVAALVSTVQAVEDFTKTSDGIAVATKIKTTLAQKHGHDNVGPLMNKVVEMAT